MNLILDDIRTEKMCFSTKNDKLLEIKWIIVRNYFDFVDFVDSNFENISIVSFDHDIQSFKDGVEFTGKTACEYLIDKCLEAGKRFPDWYVHSDNTYGRQNIIGLVLNYMKSVDGVDISGYKYFHRGYVNGKFV